MSMAAVAVFGGLAEWKVAWQVTRDPRSARVSGPSARSEREGPSRARNQSPPTRTSSRNQAMDGAGRPAAHSMTVSGRVRCSEMARHTV